MLSEHLWVGRVNEPRNAEDLGLYPEGTGDSKGLQAQEAAWSDLHFGKVSLTWVGRPDCRAQASLLGPVQ